MITQVVDTISMIQLYTDNNNIVNVLKFDCKLKLENNYVFLYDKSTSNQTNFNGEIQGYLLDYTKLINPIAIDALDLFNIIDTYIQAGVISGDATASNQVIQIGQIADNTPDQNIFKDANGSIFKDPTTFPQTSTFNEPLNQGSWFRYLKNLPSWNNQFIVQITRPANVTQYTIGDALMDNTPFLIEFTNIGASNQGIVNLASITCFDSSNQAVKPIFNYFFFRQQGIAQLDNAPIFWLDGQGDGFMGHVNGSNSSVLLSPNTSQGNSVQTLMVNPNLSMLTYPTQNVWCIIGLANNYIPTSQETFIFTFNFKP
jgi:hypothetical protein